MKLIKKMALAIACSTLMLFAFNACSEDNNGETNVTDVTLDTNAVELKIGETVTLKAIVTPDEATDKTVKWESDNEEVATVTDGVVTALSEGTVTITVITNDGGFKATCLVTVAQETTNPYLIVKPSINYILFSVDGQTATNIEGNVVDPVFTVHTNREWNVTFPEVAWFHLVKDGDKFTISVDENTDRYEKEKITVTVTVEGAEPVVIEVEQTEAPPLITLTPDTKAVTFSISGEKLYNGKEEIEPVFTVTTDLGAWTVSSSDTSWCEVVKDGDTFTLTATSANTSYTARTATVSIKTEVGNYQYDLAVTQREREGDVYVAGYMPQFQGYPRMATYWVNGVKHELTNTDAAQATSIFVDNDGHIHVAGYERLLGFDTAKYWKDGQMYLLEKNSSDRACQTSSMVIDKNGSVYIAGYVTRQAEGTSDYNMIPVYWKDGNLNLLNGGDYSKGQATSIKVDDDGTVYVGGTVYNSVDSISMAYWRNDVVNVLLEDMSSDSKITDIDVYNGEVHIIGNGKFKQYAWNNDKQKYDVYIDSSFSAFHWKDTERNLIPKAYLSSMCITADGVYICGYDGYKPMYWKNGEATILEVESGAKTGRAYSISVKGGKTYIAGCYNLTATSGSTITMPCYWVNGEERALQYNSLMHAANSNAIFVVGGE